MLRDARQEQLAQGQRQYEAGEYDAARRACPPPSTTGCSPSRTSRARASCSPSSTAAAGAKCCAATSSARPSRSIPSSRSPRRGRPPDLGPVYRNVRTQLIAEREAANQRRTTFTPTAKSEQTLQDGMIKYDAGDYDASRSCSSRRSRRASDKELQVRALKHRPSASACRSATASARRLHQASTRSTPNSTSRPPRPATRRGRRRSPAPRRRRRKRSPTRRPRTKRGPRRTRPPAGRPTASAPKKN
jgi:hypothetical protein